MECRAVVASGARIASHMIASSSTATMASVNGRHRCAVSFHEPRARDLNPHHRHDAQAVSKRRALPRSRSGARRTTTTVSASSSSSSSNPGPLRMIVLRHSDSCTEDATLKDHDRPLTEWGRTLAAHLCTNLVEAGWAEPDLVLCSASTRSRETLNQLIEVHSPIGDAETHFLGSLYHFAAMDGVTADHLRETIVAKTATAAGSESEAVRTVMCIGHNKGWQEAASDFAQTEVKLEVANAALLECESADVTTWEEAFTSVAARAEGDSEEEEEEEKPGACGGPGWRVVAVVKHGVEPQEPPASPPPMPSVGGKGEGGPTPSPAM